MHSRSLHSGQEFGDSVPDAPVKKGMHIFFTLRSVYSVATQINCVIWMVRVTRHINSVLVAPMKYTFILLILSISLMAEDALVDWIAAGDGKNMIMFQELDLGEGTIRVELAHENDSDTNFVKQTIKYIPPDPDNIMVQDLKNQKLIMVLYTLKTSNAPYAVSILNGLTGYTITLGSKKGDMSPSFDGISISAPLLQSSELKLCMIGHVMCIMKGRD